MPENNYTPTDGMASAARRALKWKEEGKRGGTRVGLARANQLAKKESLSASTVLRMHSFFSRHEVDKKATGFSSGEKGFPSPGRVAWDLWGGDAGASWSKQKRDKIMNDRMNKSAWAGVFFPIDEPALVDLSEEEDAPLEETVVEEVSVENQSVVENSIPVEEETVEETTQEAIEEVEEPSQDSASSVEEESVVEEVIQEEVVVEDVPLEETSEPEATEETSAE